MTQESKDKKIAEFKAESSTLFNIACCKCNPITDCTCPKPKKVPAKEIDFYLDQQGPRIGFISTVDYPETEKLNKRTERREKRKRQESSSSGSSMSSCDVSSDSTDLGFECDEGESSLCTGDRGVVHSEGGCTGYYEVAVLLVLQVLREYYTYYASTTGTTLGITGTTQLLH